MITSAIRNINGSSRDKLALDFMLFSYFKQVQKEFCYNL